MIETRRLKNVVIFFQTILSFVLSRKIVNINVKVFDLILRSNQTKHIEWDRTCKCKCRSNSSVCNNKQKWSEDKCR